MTTRGPLIRGACVVTALIAGSLVEACWAGDVTIKDGDTILIDGKTCRLDAIDAPELDQVCLDEHGGGCRAGARHGSAWLSSSEGAQFIARTTALTQRSASGASALARLRARR
jgi:hypothetical protein